MELTHTRILVDRYKECFLFYRNVLGFKVAWGDEESNYADFEFDGVKLGVFDRRQMAAAIGDLYRRDDSRTDRVALIFKVADVARAYEEWKERVDFITEPVEQKEWGIKVAHFRDPGGTLLEIYENL